MAPAPDAPQRDWDKELREVDKLLSKLPHADPTLGRAPGAKAVVGLRAQPPGSNAGTWLRVGLAVALALGMSVWPYAHGCGFSLLAYGAGIGVLVFTGVWGAVSSFRRQLATGHLLSLGAVLWGLVLTAGVILPRAGYAKQTATWFCP